MARKIPLLKARSVFKGRLLIGFGLRPVRLFCDHCGKYVPSDMEWLCGYCNQHNDSTRYYSFLNKCRTCKRPPEAFVCPHCSKTNFLSAKQNPAHPASKYSIRLDMPSPPAEKQIESVYEQRAKHKEELQYKIVIARLNAELAGLAPTQPPKMKTTQERLEESFAEHKTRTMGAHEIAARELEANKIIYKDNPEMLERINLVVEDWLQTKL